MDGTETRLLPFLGDFSFFSFFSFLGIAISPVRGAEIHMGGAVQWKVWAMSSAATHV
jgi:hypothetical protein